MKGLYVDQPEHVIIKEVDEPALGTDEVRIRTEYATIKHGTDFHIFSGASPFQDRDFDLTQRIFVKRPDAGTHDPYIHRYIGNTVVGVVSEVGSDVQAFNVGDRVYADGPICTSVVKRAAQLHRMPAAMSPTDALCLDPAHYAFVAVRDARPCVGDNVVVFGLGAIGLLIVQLLKFNGGLSVIAVDALEKRRHLAATFGADLVLDPTRQDVAVDVRTYLGQGADIAIEASGHYRALAEAMRSVQQCARIVTLGFYKGKDMELELGAEWLHNCLDLICSMPVWGNPMRDYPLWDEQRVMRTLETLFSKKALTSASIVDPIVPFAEVARTFTEIYHDPSSSVKLGVTFDA